MIPVSRNIRCVRNCGFARVRRGGASNDSGLSAMLQ